MSRPRTPASGLVRWEVVVGTIAVVLVLASGATDLDGAASSVRPLFPVIAFLLCVLVVAKLCDIDGLFTAIGARISHAGGGSPTVLLGLSVAAAAAVTSVLNLDATVVLLTPVLIAAARRDQHSPRPAAWASIRLANSASTLFPVSNLTNLLAYSATGLSFLRFTWLMAPVWVVAVVLEWCTARVAFRADLGSVGVPDTGSLPPLPRTPLVVVSLMLVAFAIGSPLHVEPAWPAGAAALLLSADALRRRRLDLVDVARAANLPLAYFVLCWAVVVEVVATSRVGDWVADLLPADVDLLGVLVIALVSMLLANVVNNLPATLLLVPLVTPIGPIALLAMLIGVNVGANLTYVGSLANILWLRVAGPQRPSAVRFHVIALVSTPLVVAASASVLWAWTSLVY